MSIRRYIKIGYFYLDFSPIRWRKNLRAYPSPFVAFMITINSLSYVLFVENLTVLTQTNATVTITGCKNYPTQSCSSACGATTLIYGGYNKLGLNGNLLFAYSNLTVNYYQMVISVGFFKIDGWLSESAFFQLDNTVLGNYG